MGRKRGFVNDARRVAHGRRACRNILDHDRACPDFGVVAEMHLSDDNGSGSQKDIIPKNGSAVVTLADQHAVMYI